MIRYFPAIIERSTDGYGVFFPDVAGCVSAGDTVEQAVRGAEEALQAHLDLGAEHGDAIPTPSDITQIRAEPEMEEVARVLVRAEVGSKAVRVNITMPQELLLAVDRYAKQMGYTRSGLLAQAVRERLRNETQAA